MKKSLFLLPLIIMLCGCQNNENTNTSSSSTTSEEHVCELPRLDLYILSGQSNMVGYSPISEIPAEEANHSYKNAWYYVKGEGKEAHSGQGYDWWSDELKASYFGCSKMYFGPEVGFSKFMEDKYEVDASGNRYMAMLKYSQGGSALYNRWFSSSIYKKENGKQLNIDAAGNVCPDRELDGNVVGDLYYNLVTTIREVKEYLSTNYCVHVVGMIWNQGCHDAINLNANYYEENLTDFINDLRNDIDEKDMPVCLMKIFKNIAGAPYANIVRDAQDKVSQKVNNVVAIETENGEYSSVNPSSLDPHHSGPSMLKLGYEEAKAIYSFKDKR